MGEKLLSEAEWKKFAKGKDLKDAALLKAFAAFEKQEKEPAADQLEPLKELAKQAEKLRDQNAKDKEVSKQLGDIVAAAERELARQEKQAKEDARAAQKAKEEEEADEDESSPKQLTTGLLALLREVRRGVPMQALVVLMGKRAAVMLARRAISPNRRKVLTDYLDEKGSAKPIPGTCVFEENAVTFVLAAQAAGLARKLKEAVHEQTGQRMKVRVRGEDPNDIDVDGEDVDEGAEAPGSGEPQAATDNPLKARFDARLRELQPALATALRDPQRNDTGKLRAVSGFALEKSQGGDWAAAIKSLEMLATLLAATPAAQAAAAGASAQVEAKAGDDPASAFNTRLSGLLPKVKDALAAGAGAEVKNQIAQAGALAKQRDFAAAHALLDAVEAALAAQRPTASVVQLQKSRLDWDSQRKSVQAQLQALERELRAAVAAHNADESVEDEVDDGELGDGVARLYQVLERLDERLVDKLDEALNAEGVQRLARQREAAALVREYQAFVDSDPLMAGIDDNGFIPVSIRADTQRTLAALAQQL